MKVFMGLAAVLMLTASGWAQARPANVPDDLKLLSTVSMFDKMRGQGPTTRQGQGGTTTTNPAPQPVPPPVFIGAVQDESRIVGYLEISTPQGPRIITIAPGQTLDWDMSTVTSITMDKLQLRGGSRARPEVTMGLNLLGEAPSHDLPPPPPTESTRIPGPLGSNPNRPGPRTGPNSLRTDPSGPNPRARSPRGNPSGAPGVLPRGSGFRGAPAPAITR